MRTFRFGGVLTAFVLCAAMSVAAQQGTAEISGKITDESGAVLPGVAVVVTNEATGVFREATTSSEGTFFLSQLVPGRYRVTASGAWRLEWTTT